MNPGEVDVAGKLRVGDCFHTLTDSEHVLRVIARSPRNVQAETQKRRKVTIYRSQVVVCVEAFRFEPVPEITVPTAVEPAPVVQEVQPVRISDDIVSRVKRFVEQSKVGLESCCECGRALGGEEAKTGLCHHCREASGEEAYMPELEEPRELA